MKTSYITSLLTLVLFVLVFTACKKVPDGFLSPIVRYEEDPILIQKGRTKVSSALNFDGSTKPAQIRVVHFYDGSGNIVDELFNRKSTIKGWKSLYNPETDTTVAAIEAKQFDMEVTPLIINPVSGQVEANITTVGIPEGNYSFDLEITNAAGSRVYSKIGRIQLGPEKFIETTELGSPTNVAYRVGNESSTVAQPNPTITAQRVAESPNVVVLKIVDKNGKPFNPKTEIFRRPNPGLNPVPALRPNLQGNGLGTVYTDSTTEVNFGFLNPFPVLPAPTFQFRYYYRVGAPFIHFDNLPDDQYSTNPSFTARVFKSGKYVITVRIPDVTRR